MNECFCENSNDQNTTRFTKKKRSNVRQRALMSTKKTVQPIQPILAVFENCVYLKRTFSSRIVLV